MTLTKERLIELVRQAGGYTDDGVRWAFGDFDPHKLAQLIRNEVLEEVAVEFGGVQTYTRENISASIRAMKEQL